MGVLIPTSGNCQGVEIPECNHLFEMGEHLLAAAYSGLIPFEAPSDSPCAGSLETLVSLGQPAVDLCDVLIAWLINYGASPRDRDRAETSAGGDLITPQWTATWQIELWEAAYPTAEKNGMTQISLPSAAHLHDINRLVYAHGVAMFHALTAANTDGTLWPEEVVCDRVRFTQLVPLGPSGGCAGWALQVSGPVPVFP